MARSLEQSQVWIAASAIFAGAGASVVDISFRAAGLTGDDRFTWWHVLNPAPVNLVFGALTYLLVHRLLLKRAAKEVGTETALDLCTRLMWPSLVVLVVLLVLDYVPSGPDSLLSYLWTLQPIRLWCIFVLPCLIVFAVAHAEKGES